MYKELITSKNGLDCDEEVLIVVILCLLLGDPKRA